MKHTKRETAELLAANHFDVEPNLQCVHLLEPLDEGNPDQPIALLEVVEGTIERGIEPIGFAADPQRGIDYPSVVVEVSPREYQDIRSNRLDLGPSGWTVGRQLRSR